MPALLSTLLSILALLLFCLAPVSPALAAVECFVSIPPQAQLLERVGGELIKVRVMLPPGASPHTFEPTPKQVSALAQARVYFSVGLPFERRLLRKAQQANPGLKVVDASQGIALRALSAEEMEAEEAEHGHGHGHGHGHSHKADKAGQHQGQPDPHFWLSPRLALVMAANQARSLSSLDAANAQRYETNLAALRADLENLDARLASLLAPLRGKEFLVYHPAFGYLGDAYGLKQVPVEVEGKEPGPKSMARVIDLARARGIKVVFVQPQFPSSGAAQVAQAIGGAVVAIDPLARDYIANLERMGQEIEKALK